MTRLLVYFFELIVLLFVLRKLLRAFFRLPGVPQVHVWSWTSGPAGRPAKKIVPGETARDPICGMFVSTELSQRLTLDGRTFHFCSPECLERYQKTHA
jgi:YHS domain-containing protein